MNTLATPHRHRSHRWSTPVGLALAAAVALGACGGEGDAELAPPIRIEGGGSAPESVAGADTAVDESLTMIAPPWNVTYEFEVAGDIGPLPTDDTALHFPAGVTIDAAAVAALARRLGVDGEPRPGPEYIAWQVGPDDGSAASLTVSSDALLSWWMSGPWATWPQTGAPDAVFGNLQSASGSLATPIPTGPYPLIGLDEAVARLGRIHRGFGAYPEPAVLEPAADSGRAESAPVDDPDTPVSDDEPVPAPDEPIVDPIPVDPIPVEPGEVVVETITLVAVEAATWTIWATDGSLWVVPAYRFSDRDGATFDVPAVTDEFLAIDPWFVGTEEPMVDGSGTVDPVEPDEITIEEASFVVGLDLGAAVAAADERGWSVREARRDGEDLAVTADYIPTRINVAVENGVVTDVLSIG